MDFYKPLDSNLSTEPERDWLSEMPAASTRLILDNEYNVKVRSFFIDSKYESITMSSSLWRQNVFATLEFDDSKDALMGEDNETTEVQLLEEKGAWVVEGEEEGEAEQQAPTQIEGAGAVKKRGRNGGGNDNGLQGRCTYKKNLEYSVRKIILYSKKCTPAARSAAIKKNHTPRARSAL